VGACAYTIRERTHRYRFGMVSPGERIDTRIVSRQSTRRRHHHRDAFPYRQTVVRRLSRGAVSRLLEKDVAWYGTGEYFHQKYFLVDNAWCLGSANFDMISMNRNYELNLCGQGGEMLEELQENCSALMAGGEPIRRAKINWLVRFLERAAYPIFEMFIVTRR